MSSYISNMILTYTVLYAVHVFVTNYLTYNLFKRLRFLYAQ